MRASRMSALMGVVMMVPGVALASVGPALEPVMPSLKQMVPPMAAHKAPVVHVEPPYLAGKVTNDLMVQVMGFAAVSVLLGFLPFMTGHVPVGELP